METQNWLSRPLREVITTAARSVAEGQTELDRHSLNMQRELEQERAEGTLDYALEAPWFRFSEVDASMKVALSLHGKQERDHNGEIIEGAYRQVLGAAPLSPRMKNTYNYDTEASTDLRFSIVPVPPPE